MHISCNSRQVTQVFRRPRQLREISACFLDFFFSFFCFLSVCVALVSFLSLLSFCLLFVSVQPPMARKEGQKKTQKKTKKKRRKRDQKNKRCCARLVNCVENGVLSVRIHGFMSLFWRNFGIIDNFGDFIVNYRLDPPLEIFLFFFFDIRIIIG